MKRLAMTSSFCALTIFALLPLSASASVSFSADAVNALSDGAARQASNLSLVSELQQKLQTKSAIMQSKAILSNSLGDVDNDNTLEAPAVLSSIAGYVAPTGGGFIPSALIAPQVDGYGMPLGYCVWDNGTDNSSTDRLSGANPVTNSSVSFAVLSSGKDRSFDTTCAAASSGTASGDDVLDLLTVGMGNLGIANNEYFGRPVASKAALDALDTSLTKEGEMRVVLDEGIVYGWLDLDADGTFEWSPLSSSGYFHHDDSNGATAGGEYTSTPYSLGIGAQFSDQNLSPDANLVVDGTTQFISGSGVVDTDGNAQVHIGNSEASAGTVGEIARLAIQPYGHTGGPFNIYARDDVSNAYLDFRYGALTTPADSILTMASGAGINKVGILSPNPPSTFSVGGADDATQGPVMTLHGNAVNQFESGRVRFTEGDDRMTGAFMHYDGSNGTSAGRFHIGINNVVSMDPANDINVLTIDRTGYVGLNNDVPGSTLHIRSADGPDSDTEVIIESDPDNANGEDHNPRVTFKQDGGLIQGGIGITGGDDVEYNQAAANSLYLESSHNNTTTGNIQFVTGRDNTDSLSKGTARMTILADGKIGIGTSTPDEKLTVRDGNFRMYGDTQYVDMGVYRATSATPDDNLDGYEHIAMGVASGSGIGFVGASQGMRFHPNSDSALSETSSMVLTDAGDVGIGTYTPQAKLDVAGTTMTDRLEVGDAGGSSELCLNGRCEQELRGVNRAQVTLDDVDYTPIAYVEGSELGSSIELQINGTTLNAVVNAKFDILVGHQRHILIESASHGYRQLSIKVEVNGGDDYLIYGKLIDWSGSITADVKLVAKNDDVVVFNPTNTITVEKSEIHNTYPNSKNISSPGYGEVLRISGQPVTNVTGRNVKARAPSEDMAPGWYTIAVNNGSRATARFALRDIRSSRHHSVVFYASHMFGVSSSLNVIDQQHYYSPVFKWIRIVEGGTYDGAMLQVYVDQTTNNMEAYLLGDNFQVGGWEMRDWIPDGTNPGGLSNYSALDNTAARILLWNTMRGGFSTTGSIHLAMRKNWGGSFPTDNSDTKNSIVFGNSDSEKFEIFSQQSVDNSTECGAINLDCYIFNMTDGNTVNPDGSIIFGGTGNDDVFEDYLRIRGNGQVDVSASSQASLGSGSNVFTVRNGSKWGTMGALNTSYFHFRTNSGGFYFYQPVTAVGGFSTASDVRLKKDIKSIGGAMDKIRQIGGYTYNWRSEKYPDRLMQSKHREYGVIAQELEPVLPELVMTSGDGFKTVNYDGLVPVLVEATKELDDRVVEVEVKTDKNTQKIGELEKELTKYKARVRVLEGSIPKTDSGTLIIDDGKEDSSPIAPTAGLQSAEDGRTRSVLGRFYQ